MGLSSVSVSNGNRIVSNNFFGQEVKYVRIRETDKNVKKTIFVEIGMTWM
jgi:hypothetical protein